MKLMIFTRTHLIIGAAVVILAIIIGAIWNYQRSTDTLSVVYMATGEVYIGNLSTFPRLSLKDGYQYQAVQDLKDKTKTNFQLVPISDALWAPEKMYLNRNQVVFYGPITESSKAYQALRDK